MKRRNPPPGSLPYYFQRVARDFYVQYLIDMSSHPWPLMTLLGAQGELGVRQQGIKTQQLILLLLSIDVTLSAKTSLMLEEHKPGFRIEGHMMIDFYQVSNTVLLSSSEPHSTCCNSFSEQLSYFSFQHFLCAASN